MKRVLISLLTLLFLLAVLSPAAFARAGGGGGGGGGGSGGHSSGSHSSGSTPGPRRFYRPYHSGSPAGTVAGAGSLIMVFVTIATARSFRYSPPGAQKKEAKKWLKAAAQNDSLWDSAEMKDQIREAYLAIQQSWTDNRLEDARYYLSDSLYNTFQTKLNWMAQRNERNVLRNIRLLSATPVSARYKIPGDRKTACLCCHIHGKMEDYTADSTTGRFISGSYFSRPFVEYWCFIRNADNTRWILDRIYQKDEYEGQ